MLEEQLVATLERDRKDVERIMGQIAELKVEISKPLASHQDTWVQLLLFRMKSAGQVWCSQCGGIVPESTAKLLALVEVSREKKVHIHRLCDLCRKREHSSTIRQCYVAISNSDGTFSYGFSLNDSENLIQVPSECGYPISVEAFRYKMHRFAVRGHWFFKEANRRFNMPPRIRIDMQTGTCHDMV